MAWTKITKATLTEGGTTYEWGTAEWGASPWGGSDGDAIDWTKLTKPTDVWTKIEKAT